jgi:DNA-binding NtrC family response regulator
MNETKKILIIDDEAVIVNILKRRFERMGFSVATALNGSEGIETLRHEKVDLVVCDIKMPKGISGMDVLNASKKYNPNVRFVAISGHLLSDESVEGILKDGASMYVKKPFPSLGEVTQQIADLLGNTN